MNDNNELSLSTDPNEYCVERLVEHCSKGEYVKRKPGAAKVYTRGDYDRSSGKYSLIDEDDVNREVFVKKGTPLFVGFSY